MTSNTAASAGTLTTTGERWLLLATVLASSMAFIDSTALNVALDALQTSLNASGADLLWVVNAYALLLAALLLAGGALGDLYGRKRVFMIGITVFTAASLACGAAADTGSLILFRAVQGAGAALLVPGSLSLITALVNPARRGRAIGTWSTLSTLTTLGGPVLGGFLAGAGLWRLVFFINVPLGLLALWILARHVPESRTSARRRLDIPGTLFATLGLAGITYGFIQASDVGWAGAALPLAGGALALGLFLLVEWRSPHPMMPLGLFRSSAFSGANLLTLFLYAALAAAPFFLTLNLIQVQGYPEQNAGATFVPFALLLGGMSRWAGGLVDRVGARLPLVVGPAIAGVGFLLLALPELTGGAETYLTTYFPGIVVLGMGMGITVAPLSTTVMNAAPQESAGTASGINNAVARTAGVLAIAILGALALAFFRADVLARAETLGITDPAARAQLEAEAARFGQMQPDPDLFSAEQISALNQAIDLAFVGTFRLVAVIAAALAWLSALMAALLVPRQPAAT